MIGLRKYVNLANVPLSLGIQGGVPYNWAVTLDNTNFAAASWTPYTSSNITANLGTNAGLAYGVGWLARPARQRAANMERRHA